MRGLREPTASWNTICTSRRYWRRSAAVNAAMFLPRKRATPPEDGWRRSRVLAIVDLPLPDSPTMPSVSPACRSKETPRTASTAFSPGRRYVTCRFSTWNRTSPVPRPLAVSSLNLPAPLFASPSPRARPCRRCRAPRPCRADRMTRLARDASCRPWSRPAARPAARSWRRDAGPCP